MVPSRWWTRPLLAVLTAWLVLLRAEPVPLHACAMHDGAGHGRHHAAAAAPATATTDAHASHAAHDAHAGHDPAASAPVPDTAPAGAPDDEGCLCLGCCNGVPATVAVVEPPLAWLATILEVTPRVAATGALERPAPRDDVALPYPNAPPAAPLA